MTVLVDRRVGSRDLVALLPRGYAQETDLEYGDAVVVGNGPHGPVTESFERKRLSDSLACLKDGRFAAHQLIGLRESYDFVWLVIEDEIRKHPDSGVLQRVTGRKPLYRNVGRRKRVIVGEEVYWSDALFGKSSTIMWRDFMHWLMSMCRQGGVDDFIFTRNAQETADLIWTVHTWRQKDWKQHKSLKTFNTSHRGGSVLFRPPHVAEIAKTYKDVGFDTAIAIADQYASPHEFACRECAKTCTSHHSRLMEHELSQLVVTTRKDGAKVRLGKPLAESIVGQTKERRVVKCRT